MVDEGKGPGQRHGLYLRALSPGNSPERSRSEGDYHSAFSTPRLPSFADTGAHENSAVRGACDRSVERE